MKLRRLLQVTSVVAILATLAIIATYLFDLDECAPEVGASGCNREAMLDFLTFPGGPALMIAIGLLIYLRTPKVSR